MKTKTIEVILEDYCPEDCEEFRIDESILYAGGELFLRQYRCAHVETCDRLMEHLKTHINIPVL